MQRLLFACPFLLGMMTACTDTGVHAGLSPSVSGPKADNVFAGPELIGKTGPIAPVFDAATFLTATGAAPHLDPRR